jgi:hypothetical protein
LERYVQRNMHKDGRFIDVEVSTPMARKAHDLTM